MKISLAHVVLNMYVCMDTFEDENNNLESSLRWAMSLLPSLLLLLASVLLLSKLSESPRARLRVGGDTTVGCLFKVFTSALRILFES